MWKRRRPKGLLTELQHRRYDLGYELKARFYFYKPKGFIVSSVAGIAEVGEPTILNEDCPDKDLGQVISNHLLEHDKKSPNVSQITSKDWKAFVASKAKSVRSFNEKSWTFEAETKNSAVIITAKPSQSLHSSLSVSAMANHNPEKMGKATRLALVRAMALRDAGLL